MRTPIRVGEAGAAEALEVRIAKAEKLQDHMKTANAVIRKNVKAGRDAQMAALAKLDLDQGAAAKLLKGDYMGRVGYASYLLTNNGANIKRMQEQLTKAARLEQTETSEQMVGAVRIVDNADADRVQVFFPVARVDKPVYEILKAHGFRWTPSLDCFQALRGQQADFWASQAAAAFNAALQPA